jgi:hypothetical protein
LNLPASGLEAEHPHLQRVSPCSESGQLIPSGFVGGGEGSVIGLRGNHGCARNWLAGELHSPGLRMQDQAKNNESCKKTH